MAQIKLNTIQIVLMAHFKNLLIQIILIAHICQNDMIQLKDMFQIVATWLQFSTEEYWCVTTPRVNKKKSSIGFFLEKNPFTLKSTDYLRSILLVQKVLSVKDVLTEDMVPPANTRHQIISSTISTHIK